MSLKNKIEALLFSSGRRMSLSELSKLTKHPEEAVKGALTELKMDYEERNASLMIIEEGENWKISVKEDHLSLVTKIVSETELSKTLMETLAVIAMRYPIKQCDLIKMRTNKAYDHLKELEEIGYITRQKYGRTKLIRLSQKFFDYFALPEEELRDKFQDFKSMADAIENKEEEIEKQKEEDRKRREEEKKAAEVRENEIDLVDEEGHKEKLETYEAVPETESTLNPDKIDDGTEKIGNLEVVDTEGGSGEDKAAEGAEEHQADSDDGPDVKESSDEDAAKAKSEEDRPEEDKINDNSAEEPHQKDNEPDDGNQDAATEDDAEHSEEDIPDEAAGEEPESEEESISEEEKPGDGIPDPTDEKQQSEIDKRVDAMLHPPKDEDGDDAEEDDETKDDGWADDPKENDEG